MILENLKIQGKPITRMMLLARTMIIRPQRSLMFGFILQRRLFLTCMMNSSCYVRNQKKKAKLSRRKLMIPIAREESRQRTTGRR